MQKYQVNHVDTVRDRKRTKETILSDYFFKSKSISTQMKKAIYTLLFTTAATISFGQKKELTNEQILKNKLPAIISPLPLVMSWEKDNELVIRKKLHPDSAAVTYLINPKTGKEQLWQAPPVVKPVAHNRVTFKSNDLYLTDTAGNESRLTNDKDKENTPLVSPDRKYVAFTKRNNFYVIDLDSKKETQVTNDGSDVILNGYASWVYMEEILGRATAYKAFWWSPDSKHISFFRSDDSQVPTFTLTDAPGDHGVVEITRYPKVGDKNPEVKVGIFSIVNGKTVWADFNQKEDQYFGMPYWTPDGSALLQTWMDRKQENLKIYAVNPDNGSKKEFYSEHQDSWVEFDEKGTNLTFLKNGKGYLYTSDKTGYNHIYFFGPDNKLINAVTEGKYFVVSLVEVDEKNSLVYFTARGRENNAHTDFYSIKLNGKDLKRLTFGNYSHSIQLSPSRSYFVTTYGNANTPNKIALMDYQRKTGNRTW